MTKRMYLFLFGTTFWLAAAAGAFGATELPGDLRYCPGLYGITIMRGGSFTIAAGSAPICARWSWPLVVTGEGPDKGEEIAGRVEDSGADTRLVRIKGRTSGCLYEENLTLTPDAVGIEYVFEARKKLDRCAVALELVGSWIAGKEYEWGPRPGTPEEKGVFSAEPLAIDRSPGYLKILDMDGRDVVFRFQNAEAVVVTAAQWHNFGRGHPEQCALSMLVYPRSMKKNQPVEPGAKGNFLVTVSFAPGSTLKIVPGLVDAFEQRRVTWETYGGVTASLDSPGAGGTQSCLRCSLGQGKSFGGAARMFPSPKAGAGVFVFWAKGDGDLKVCPLHLVEEQGGFFHKGIVLDPEWKKYEIPIRDFGYEPGPWKKGAAKPADFSRVCQVRFGWDFPALKPDISHAFRIDEIGMGYNQP